jgi:UDP-GlcNAc:undecaprenyl-phosphate GlcNAc-1-phosphate transferase
MSFNLFLQLLSVFISTSVLILILIKLAPKLKLIDIPNHRSVHTKVVPRGAGIAIILSLFISDILFQDFLLFERFSIYLTVGMILLIGILDDRHDTKPKIKFAVIFIAVLILYFDGISITTLGRFCGIDLELYWMALPFTFFAVAGFTNALNLVDGLDGLAGGVSIVILTTLSIIGFTYNDPFIYSLSLTLLAAISAFMLFNWNPARIFMGDSGSLTIGFIIAILSIKALPYIQPTSVLFIAAIPIMDTLIVMVRRLRNGKSPFSPDKLHIHHLLLRFFNGNVKKTTLFLIMMQTLYSMIGLSFSDYEYQRYIFILFTLNTLILYMLFSGMITRQERFSRHRKKKN